MTNFLRSRFSKYQEVKIAKEKGAYPFFRPFHSKQGTVANVQGKDVLMFGSNSYLGLTTHPKVLEASENALRKYGASCAGSRFLNGTTDLHLQLEHEIAEFIGKEKALVFSTGFHVNIGTLPTITKKDDIILLDRMNHASLYEGAKMSEASNAIYRHNNASSLDKKLTYYKDADLKLVATDGIFSMEGNIVNLPEIVKTAKSHGAAVMVDCAHAVGVIGDHGKGTADHFGLTDEVDLIGGTFSKSFASLGGFIAGDEQTIDYIQHNARSLIFSASITPASTAAALASLNIMKSDDSLRLKLWENTRYALGRLKESGFDIGSAETPIIPIYIKDNDLTFKFVTRLFEEGLFVNPVLAPAVPPEDSLVRFSLMATHTFEQIDSAIDMMERVGKELGLITQQKSA